MTTQEECVEVNKEMNSMHEENDVLKRHMTWWRDAWWVRMDNGPHLRTARGRRRVWRAATRAAREARETERVAGREREKGEQGTTGRREKATHYTLSSTSRTQAQHPQQSQQPQRQQQQCACSDGHGYHCDDGQRDCVRHYDQPGILIQVFEGSV